MTDEELLRALRRIAVPDEHRCFGCGYEHNCGLHGCAIINAAAERIRALRLSEREDNEPLTVAELLKMDGEPVWCVSRHGESRWGIVHVYDDTGDGFECYTTEYGRIDGWSYGMVGMGDNFSWLAYRRRTEED